MPRIGSQGNNARQLRHAWRLSLLLLLLSVVVLGVIVFASAELALAQPAGDPWTRHTID